jgi:hypothetical protein
MKMVDILKMAIKADRTGNWLFQLSTLQRMLPYFASSGHHLYTKSVHLYIQEMLHLNISHPKVYEAFINGKSVIRRSDRFWSGLPPDLIIEQVLMRSIKTSGGLTRGRGMNENQLAVWLLSMPECAEMNNAMQEFTDTAFCASEQHKEMTTARQNRDLKNMKIVAEFLSDRNPFTDDVTLRNIANGAARLGHLVKEITFAEKGAASNR